jgi:hypothetical protein
MPGVLPRPNVPPPSEAYVASRKKGFGRQTQPSCTVAAPLPPTPYTLTVAAEDATTTVQPEDVTLKPDAAADQATGTLADATATVVDAAPLTDAAAPLTDAAAPPLDTATAPATEPSAAATAPPLDSTSTASATHTALGLRADALRRYLPAWEERQAYTAEQKDVMARFRKSLESEELLTEWWDNPLVFARFCEARQFNLSKALEMFKAHLAWRKTVDLDEIMQTDRYYTPHRAPRRLGTRQREWLSL